VKYCQRRGPEKDEMKKTGQLEKEEPSVKKESNRCTANSGCTASILVQIDNCASFISGLW
jgi:hypothetical protein